MLTYYFSKSSSAIAAHILLEEVGAEYQAVEVSIPDGAHRSADFLARNPKGRIPVLGTPQGHISENPAILEYIAATHPQAGMQPEGAFAQAQARSFCAYICATAHVAFAHRHRGARWATQEASYADMQQKVPQNLQECAQLLEQELALDPWVLGARYTYCDPYLFMFMGSLAVAEVDVAPYPKLRAHQEAMLERPATQRIVALNEG
jgi:glutathione S-transferase